MKLTGKWTPTNYNNSSPQLSGAVPPPWAALGTNPLVFHVSTTLQNNSEAVATPVAECKQQIWRCTADILPRQGSLSAAATAIYVLHRLECLYFLLLNQFKSKNTSCHVTRSAPIPAKMSTKHYQQSAFCSDDPCVPWLLAPRVTWPVGPVLMRPPWLLLPQWQSRKWGQKASYGPSEGAP